MPGYDPSAANEYNQLIQQGLDPEEAAVLAGISLQDLGNYSEVNGLLTENEGLPTRDTNVGPQTDYGTTYDAFGTVVPVAPPTQDTPVNPASDPSQFPAYDDEGNLQPGFAINEETGEPYYRGLAPPTQQTAGFDPNFDEFGNLDAAIATQQASGFDPYYDEFAGLDAAIAQQQNAVPVNNPYYGLTPEQIQKLGGADPTDPYIRARLGIPQLPGSPIAATPGFGTIKTGIPLVDSALSFLGGLFGSSTPSTKAAATSPTASSSAALGNTPPPTPAVTPPTQDTAVNPSSDPSQFPAYDDEGNLLPGYAVNSETGEPYYQGFSLTNTDTTTLSAEQADAFYNGTSTLTPTQLAAMDAQTAADAAILYPGTDNTNLREINAASAAIAQNEAGIANAQNIIAQNNAELADPNISDARRAELEANNAAQENYIRLAESNTAENELVIEANADAFAAGGGNPNSGQAAPEVDPATDTGIVEPLADEETAALFAEEVDPATDTGVITPLADEETAALFAEDVDPATDTGVIAPLTAEEADALFAEDVNADDANLQLPPGAEDETVESEEPFALNPDEDTALQLPPGAEDEQVEAEEPFALNPDEDQAIADQQDSDEGADPLGDAATVEANNLAAMKIRAQSQATLQSRFKTPGDQDWRVRLQLSPNSDYLYNDSNPGILAPLRATNGVLFPYVPQITTNYQANYEQYDLTHSNYRGIFYKNSRVGDIQIRGTFTAQDTKEAEYLLAVIHFFRSVTKMFYGQDWQRGTPPPMVFLSGFGNFQFNGHPCVVNAFNYTLPNDVDYIRATNFNNYGTNLFNRRSAPQSSPGGINAAGAIRLANALLPKGALPNIPAVGPVNGAVTNTQSSTYVPTKLEIDITLIPVQTRSQISKQFSMQEFANGNLIRGGFW